MTTSSPTTPPANVPLEKELGLTTCSSAGKSWCNLGVSVGVGGGIGLFGVAMFCAGIYTIFVVEAETHVRVGLCFVALGMLWCLAWAVGVVIWGGEDGVTYVGIMWGVPILVSVAVIVGIGCQRRTKDEQ